MYSIEISINNIGIDTHLYININENKVITKNFEKKISQEKINKLIRIIRTWNAFYQSDNKVIDEESFIIKIKYKDGIDIIQGKGSFPSNYNAFKNWIGELYD